MGSLALGVQRLLPSMQLIYSSWAKIKSVSYSVNNIEEWQNIILEELEKTNDILINTQT